jgi:hypothetical protein
MTEYGCGVRVDVLGPLRVTDSGGTDVTPDGALQRRLLALLVLRCGQVPLTPRSHLLPRAKMFKSRPPPRTER